MTAANFPAYLAHPSVFAVGASWFVSRTAIASGDYAAITRGTADALGRITA